jgi:hypothetical protein
MRIYRQDSLCRNVGEFFADMIDRLVKVVKCIG